MTLRKEYIKTSEAASSNPKALAVISDDAFAICDLIEQLSSMFERSNRRRNG